MKRILFSILLLAAAACSFADNTTDARKTLDNLSSRITNGGGATAQFTLSGGQGTLSGTVAIKQKKFRVSTSAMTVWYNGTTQWVYVKANEEVNISTPSAAAQMSMNPYAFLAIYKKGYALSIKKEGQTKTVTMVSKTNAITDIVITLGKGDVPVMVRFRQKGAWTTIRLSAFKIARQSDARFVFDAKKYPKAEVIDLR